MEKKLEVNNLVISFRTQGGKVQAVRDISFDLYKGETLAIVGESGSGKSVTNRAIIGILAGNAIVESGEIIYDGKDLLKIPEEEFHKIRGDKIAMIFQDPMSSLNPIMKVGKQLTEAMLLKAGATRRNARKEFNGKLAELNANMDAVSGGDAAKIAANKEACKTFDNFCINSTKLESAYNTIYKNAEELKYDIENALFLISKHQAVDVHKTASHVLSRIKTTVHPDIVVMTDEVKAHLNTLGGLQPSQDAHNFPEEGVEALKALDGILENALHRKKPNYFTLGYYMMRNPQANVDDMDIDELTAMTRKYLDDEFMLSFIEEGSQAIKYSHDNSMAAKKQLLSETETALEYFRGDLADKKQTNILAIQLSDKVEAAIDRLSVIKNSAEYTFRSSIRDAIKKYYYGVKNNAKETARFQKESAKYQKLVAAGKLPDWSVVPMSLVDLELCKKNIRAVIHNLRNSIRNELEKDSLFDASACMVDFIDHQKEQASNVVYRITPKMAKAKAIKLMEEVGIPEPEIRYNQYPFEFSGGMRQRIVIAIALAANPDILICDEPTTALDVTIQSQILELINSIKAKRNLSVIFITHDLGVVANMADRIAVMYAGKIVEYGTADDVFYDPRHPYTWALLSSMPDLDTKEKLEAIPGTPPNMIYPPVGDAFAARNKYAMQIDFEMQPPMFKVSDTHYAATWLLHPNAPKVEPPKIVADRIARMNGRIAEENDGGENNG